MACKSPFYKDFGGVRVPLPCGKCLQCRIDNRNQWTWRIMAELKHSDGVFVTLTIDDEHLQGSSLYKKSIQDYHKRLRKNLKGRKIKYFTVGEYGKDGLRPHYHEILMNVSAGKPMSNDLGDIPVIRKSWGFGFIKVERATKGTIRYVLKYLDKMQDDNEFRKAFPELNPPFRLISKGIGQEFISKGLLNILNKKLQVFFDGSWRPLPRYYKDKLGLIDKFREDWSDVSLFSQVKDNPKRLGSLSKALKYNPLGFYHELERANTELGAQELLDLEKKSEIGSQAGKI